MFGNERLSMLLQRHPTAGRRQGCVAAIFEAVSEFHAGTDHFDDETVVVLRALSFVSAQITTKR